MSSLWLDVRYALRMMVKARWFTLAAALPLALGIGANTTVFTLVNAVLLRGLPFPDSDRIVFVGGVDAKRGNRDIGVSALDLEDWRRTLTGFEGLEAWDNATMNLSEPGRPPERARGELITAGAFRLLRQEALNNLRLLGTPGAKAYLEKVSKR